MQKHKDKELYPDYQGNWDIFINQQRVNHFNMVVNKGNESIGDTDKYLKCAKRWDIYMKEKSPLITGVYYD